MLGYSVNELVGTNPGDDGACRLDASFLDETLGELLWGDESAADGQVELLTEALDLLRRDLHLVICRLVVVLGNR